jgi:hypothetical protein
MPLSSLGVLLVGMFYFWSCKSISTDHKENATCTVRYTRGSTAAPGKVAECCRDICCSQSMAGEFSNSASDPRMDVAALGYQYRGRELRRRRVGRSGSVTGPTRVRGTATAAWTRTRRPKTTVSQALARSGGGSVSPAVAQVCVRPCACV